MEAYPSTESTHDEPPPRQPGRVEPLRGQEAPKRAPTKGIVAFLVLAFGAAWGIWVPFWLLDVSEESRLFALVYVTLFAPALAAIVVRRWLADSGDLYVQATTMTFAGIVMGQVGAGLAMRTTRESVFSVGPLSNRFLLWSIAFELAFAASLAYVPGLSDAFYMRPLEPWHWLFLLAWPLLVVTSHSVV